MSKEIPDGWATIPSSTFCTGRNKSFNPKKEDQKNYVLYSVPSHATGDPEILHSKEIGSSKQFVSEGDVLISKINPHLNRTWVVGDHKEDNPIASTEWIVFRRNTAIQPRFLSLFLRQGVVRDFLCHNASGVGGSLTRIKPAIFGEVELALPPLAEQKRIVTKIEELFSELDAGEQSFKQARKQLGIYRQSLLKQAFEGKLTEAWRQANPDQLEDPDQLLARIQQEREARHQQQLEDWQQAVDQWEQNGKEGKKPAKPKKIKTIEAIKSEKLRTLSNRPYSWKFEKLGNLATKITDGEHATPKRTSSGNYLLSARNVRDGFVSLSNVDYIPDCELSRILKRCDPDYRDILISCSGSVGRIALVPKNLVFGLVRSVALVKFPQTLILPEFLLFQLQSPSLQQQIDEGKKATAQANLFLGPISELIISICSLPEQQEIVRLLEEQFTVIEQNEREIDAALKRSAGLRQSILKRAFSGQLVPQDPTDEPASELLARIQQERSDHAATKKAKKAAKKKTTRKRTKKS